MSDTVRILLLTVLIVSLYVISSRWRTTDETQRMLRLAYWIGLAAVALLLVLILAWEKRME